MLRAAVFLLSLLVLTGCASSHGPTPPRSPLIDTDTYSDRALEEMYELKQGASLLSYGRAHFKNYIYLQKDDTRVNRGNQFFSVMGGLPWSLFEAHRPEGLYEIFSCEINYPDTESKREILWLMNNKTLDGKKMVAKATPINPLNYLLDIKLEIRQIGISQRCGNDCRIINLGRGKIAYSEYDYSRHINQFWWKRYLHEDEALKDFSPAEIVKIVKESPENSLKSLRFDEISDKALTLTYWETEGATEKNFEKIVLPRREDGQYQVKGISFTVETLENGQEWFILHSFFDGDRQERFYEMLPLGIR